MTNNKGSWKEILTTYYTKVPKTVGEALWKGALTLTAAGITFAGYTLYRNPDLVTGRPWEQRSPTEILAIRRDIRQQVLELMNDFYVTHRPDGLMFVSWEELDSLRGLWVRPADEFPGKSGLHQLTADMRVLGGPFLFGECAATESLAMTGMTMVACPVNNNYDAWGYVAAIVEPGRVPEFLRLVEFLAHRITNTIY
tara:strand:- start:127 stop:717 length:591 start_codon:yes stop_codon:yes gene_type:complete